MKIKSAQMILIAGATLLAGCKKSGDAAVDTRPPQDTVSHASDFSSVEYFDPPDEKQMKSRISGAEAQPLAGGLLVIKQLKLETFGADGKPEWIVNAPNCIYDVPNGVANSPSQLQLQTGGGKFRVEGEGFLWRRTNEFLTISNNVQTIIENGIVTVNPGQGAAEKKIMP